MTAHFHLLLRLRFVMCTYRRCGRCALRRSRRSPSCLCRRLDCWWTRSRGPEVGKSRTAGGAQHDDDACVVVWWRWGGEMRACRLHCDWVLISMRMRHSPSSTSNELAWHHRSSSSASSTSKIADFSSSFPLCVCLWSFMPYPLLPHDNITDHTGSLVWP
jgi:hypothetical protein